MTNPNDPRAIPPLPSTHELYGDTPTYTPTPGITEDFGGVSELRSPDMHELVRDEALEPATDIEGEA